MKAHFLTGIFCFSTLLTASAADEISVNRQPSPDKVIVNGEKWKWSFSRDFAAPADEWLVRDFSKNLKKHWRQHSTEPQIKGYNGTLTYEFYLPHPANELQAEFTVANYADSRTRHARLEYSLDNIDYSILAEGDFASGSLRLNGKASFPDSNRRIWLRAGFAPAGKDDKNANNGYVLLKSLNLVLSGKTKTFESFKVPNPELAPMGVYLSWEIPRRLAESNGISQRAFLEKLFTLCRERNVNFIWITNLPWAQLPATRELAQKYGMTLVANCSDGKYEHYFKNDAAELKNNIEQMVYYSDNDPNLTDWILGDEPRPVTAENLKTYRKLLRAVDPVRRAGVVIMPHDTELINKAEFDTAAVDAYPFFGPGDPNGPHTPQTSRSYYRASTTKFISDCRAAGTIPWLMPQSFVEILGGPYKYNDKGEIIALPGSYFHWRMPEVPEIRWQFWEALRLGARGICFFELVPIMKWNDTTDQLKVKDDFAWKDALLKSEANAGFGGLTTPWGTPTPQFDEIGRLYQEIEPYRTLITRWQPMESPAHWSNCPMSFFQDTKEQKIYMLAVNEDFDKELKVEISIVGGATITPFVLQPGAGKIIPLP